MISETPTLLAWGAPETVQIMLFLHRVDHLRWRKGLGPLPESAWVAECWMPEPAPAWALASAAAGESGSHWCPKLCPALADTPT